MTDGILLTRYAQKGYNASNSIYLIKYYIFAIVLLFISEEYGDEDKIPEKDAQYHACPADGYGGSCSCYCFCR